MKSKLFFLQSHEVGFPIAPHEILSLIFDGWSAIFIDHVSLAFRHSLRQAEAQFFMGTLHAKVPFMPPATPKSSPHRAKQPEKYFRGVP
ncbi:hypothetical protein CCP4SC76_5740016 [Gammaproteobacteria bacterium]